MKISLRKLFKLGQHPYLFLTGWGLFWLLNWLIFLADSGKVLSQNIPNFNQLTFDSLPSASEDGAVTVPTHILEKLDDNPARTWQKGQPIETFLKLGDFQDSWKLQLLSLQNIEQATGQSLADYPLDSFELLSQQTLGTLVDIVPGLKNKKLSQVPLFKDLLTQNGYQTSQVLNEPIGSLTERFNSLRQLSLNQLDLSQYRFNDLEGLTSVPLQNFTGWQNSLIASIPGLSFVPFVNFPNPPMLSGGGVAKIDWILSEVEQPAQTTISGSDRLGYNVPCQKQCAHIELADNPLVAGQQWVSGKFQSVEGGHGVLKSLFGGQEPTGRHPFGNGFKVVLWDVDEVNGKVNTAWFFRICQRGLINLGCSPYGIGPIPAFSYQEKDWIFLGQ